ncbi:MAG TPA: hypothetical protein VJK72_04050 [Candidatus Nanoarchaeia archaeon]|nr:hypothetical protein [Candidatus Nanoarchaeia archaeon]
MRINAIKCYHIKLGQGDEWAEESIRKNRIYFGYRELPHFQPTERSDIIIKQRVKTFFPGKTQSTITNHANQISYFYNEPETTLWITFFNGYLYYTFANTEIHIEDGNRKYRETIGNWKCTDVKDKPLSELNIRGDLRTKKYFRGTICEVDKTLLDYLLMKINCEEDPVHSEIVRANEKIGDLIKRLSPKDFELLIDMIFMRSGVIRTTPIGGSMKNIDYAGFHPLTGKMFIAQCKSTTNEKEIEKYLGIFAEMDKTEKGAVYIYFVNNESKKYNYMVNKYRDEYDLDIELFDSNRITSLVVKLGLVDWVLEKT